MCPLRPHGQCAISVAPAAPSRRGPGDLPCSLISFVSPSAPVEASPGTAPVPLPGGALLVTWPLTAGAPCVREPLCCCGTVRGGGGARFSSLHHGHKLLARNGPCSPSLGHSHVVQPSSRTFHTSPPVPSRGPVSHLLSPRVKGPCGACGSVPGAPVPRVPGSWSRAYRPVLSCTGRLSRTLSF